MSKKPSKMDGITSARGNDHWAPGQRADGSIKVMTIEEALKVTGADRAYDDAFGALLGDIPEDLNDVSDLDEAGPGK